MSIIVPPWPNQRYEDTSHHLVLDSRTPSPRPAPKPAPKPTTQTLSARTVTEDSTVSDVHTCTEMLKQSMSESRRTFLQDFNASQEAVTLRKVEEPPVPVHEMEDKHGYRKRKISFKIKNTLTPSKRITTTTLSANKVHQLAQKYNQLVNEEPKIARAARRANSTRIRESTVDAQKRPSIRPKPAKLEERKLADQRKKPSVKRKVSVKKIRMEKQQDSSEGKMCVTAKIKYLEEPQTVQQTEVVGEEQNVRREISQERLRGESSDFKYSEQSKTSEQCAVKQTDISGNNSIQTSQKEQTAAGTDEVDSPATITQSRPMLKTRSTSTGSVKAAIEIFERRKSSTAMDISKANKLEKQGSNNSITRLQHSVDTTAVVTVKNLVPKPKVPDKNVTKTKNLVTKEGVRRFRIITPKIDSENVKTNMSELQTYFATKSIGKNDKTRDTNALESSQIIEKSVKRNIFPQEDDSKHNLSSYVSSNEDIKKRLTPSDEKLLHATDLSSSSCEDTVLEVKHIPHNASSRISVTIDEEQPAQQHVEIEKANKSSSSLYDGLKITRTTPPSQLLKMAVSEERLVDAVQPNTSFLWRSKSRDSTYFNTYTAIMYEDGEEPMADDDSKKICKSLYEDTGQPDLKLEETRRYSQYDEPKSALVNKELADILKKRREQDATQEDEIYDTIKNVIEQRVTSVGEPEANLEDLYDTVDPRPMQIPTVNAEADKDESLVEEILAKTDEILRQYNNPKPEAATKIAEEAAWKDNESIHSYESFYNSNYEEMDTHYEYPKNLVQRTESNVSEDLYETLSIKTTPEKDVPQDTNAKSVYQKPLPLLPNETLAKETSGKVSNIYQKPLPQIPNVTEVQTDKDSGSRSVNIYQKPLPQLPQVQTTGEKAKIYYKPLPRLPNENNESDQCSSVKIIKKPLPQIPTAQFYHEDAEEVEENIYSTLSNASTPQKSHTPLLVVPKINVQGPNVSPKYLKPVFPPPQSQKEDLYDFLKSPSDCYESIYNDAVNRSLNNKYLQFMDNTDTVSQLSSDIPGCYESIYNGGYRKEDTGSMYHSSLLMCRRDGGSSSGSNRDSVISCDQQSNSLYGKCGWNIEGGPLGSEISSSDRSDDWEDMSDAEQEDKAEAGFVIIHEKQRNKKHPGWSLKVRDQWTNSPKKGVIREEDASSDPYHYYESLHSDDDFDSFDSESDDDSFTKINQNDSGVDMGHPQLPEPPGANSGASNIYGFTRLAASANKHMKRLRRNWSLTKNDITKSLSRMTKKKSTTNLSSPSPDRPGASPTLEPPPVPRDYEKPVKIYDKLEKKPKPVRPVPPLSSSVAQSCVYSSTSLNKSSASAVYAQTGAEVIVDSGKSYQNVEYKSGQGQIQEKNVNTNTVGRRKNWLKFRRSTSMTEPTSDEANSMTKSTFYLTSEMDVDTGQVTIARPTSLTEERPAVPARRRARPPSTQRPASPPPPAPVSPSDNSPTSKSQKSRSTSWYAECGLFKPTGTPPAPSAQLILPPLPTSSPPPPAQYQQQGNTCWYAEVGLYQQNGSTPSSSSAENSGSTTSQYPKHYQQHYQQSKQQEHTMEFQQLHSQLHTQLQQYHLKERNQQNVNDIVNQKERKNVNEIVNKKECNQQNGNEKENQQNVEDTEQYYNMMNDRTSAVEDEEVENSYYNEEFPPVVLRRSVESSEGEAPVRDTLKRHQSADMQLLLKDEPLYQFYDAAVAECACQETSSDSDYDGYEEIGTQKNTVKEGSVSPLPPSTPTSVKPSVKQLVSPVRNGISGRTLWCEIPEIIQSEILCTLNPSQRKLQEAKFEIITSEASYLNSLTVLEEHFMSVLDKDTLLDSEDRATLFGNIRPVRECSERLLGDLEMCWQDNILLNGICEVIYMHCIEHFDVYVRYCEGQVHLSGALKRCRERKNAFSEALRQLELKPACQALSLYSFLMLPMQRITRMPLLIDAVLKRLTPADDEYKSCQQALMSLNDIVMRCNEGARKVERQVETARIARLLEYPAHIPAVELTGRYLIRSGEITQLVTRNDEVKLTFGKKFTKIPLTLFLFEDILLVTRKKNNSSNEDYFTVLHHCPRNFVELTTTSTDNSVLTLPVKDLQGRHLLFLTMLENQEHRTVEMMLSCATVTDRERWLEALSPPVSDNPYERVYESWDCPQVRAVHWYNSTQPDELALTKGDVVNVTRKMADGWYHGERIRDGVSGWFPGNHTTEIANPHVRARNLKQRYRLLAFTGNYLNKTNNNK